MGLLNRYILRQTWMPCLLASAVIAVVVIGGGIQEQVSTLLEDLPIAQFTFWDLGQMAFYLLPALVGYILPVTFLLGIMLTFGRMAQSGEITAMKAAGIPLKRIILPVILLGLFLSGFCFLAMDRGQTWAYRQLNALVSSDLPLRISLDMLPAGVMHEYGDWRVYIGSKDGDGALRDIVVLKPASGGQMEAFYADSASLIKKDGKTQLQLREGLYIRPSKRGEDMVRGDFTSTERPVPPLIESTPPTGREGMTLGQLYQAQRASEKRYLETWSFPEGAELRKLRIDLSERLAFPLMCLAVAVVGSPAGARTRRSGRSYAFALGFAVVAVYFVLRKLAEPTWIPGPSSEPPPLPVFMLLAQIPNLLLFAVGGWMVRRVDRV